MRDKSQSRERFEKAKDGEDGEVGGFGDASSSRSRIRDGRKGERDKGFGSGPGDGSGMAEEDEVITTIFVVGFPDDITVRQVHCLSVKSDKLIV